MRFFFTVLLAALAGFAFSPSRVTAQAQGPAFTSIPELEQGYRLLYQQKFSQAREVFQKWAEQHPTEPFGQVSLAATYLFEEFYLQNVLTSEYFMDDKKFLGGITGTPDPGRIKGFEDSCGKARSLAGQLLKSQPKHP